MATLTLLEILSTILLKAFEKSGEKLGETTFNRISTICKTIFEKLRKKGTEGKFTQAQLEPSSDNIKELKQEIAIELEADNEFFEELYRLVKELKNEPYGQIFLHDVNVSGNAEVGDIDQALSTKHSIRQEAISKVSIGGNLKVGNVKQQA